MKKLFISKIAFLLIVLLLFVMATSSAIFGYLCANATDSQWVRIVDDSTPLYPTASTIKTSFNLAKSYYLKVIDTTNEFYHVSIMANSTAFPSITGYVLKSDVEFCDSTPVLPHYPQVTLTVNTSNADVHFSPLKSSQLLIVATNTQTLSYYGSVMQNGTLWYYVYFANRFGYVESSSVTPPAIALHSTPLADTSVPGNTDPTDDPKVPPAPSTDISTGEILMIIFVVLLSIGLVLALFYGSPNKNKSSDVYERH